MGVIDVDDIRGYREGSNGTIYCCDCMKDEQAEEFTEDQYLTSEEVDEHDKKYFCDTCKKPL
jgi:hypothetical protein